MNLKDFIKKIIIILPKIGNSKVPVISTTEDNQPLTKRKKRNLVQQVDVHQMDMNDAYQTASKNYEMYVEKIIEVWNKIRDIACQEVIEEFNKDCGYTEQDERFVTTISELLDRIEENQNKRVQIRFEKEQAGEEYHGESGVWDWILKEMTIPEKTGEFLENSIYTYMYKKKNPTTVLKGEEKVQIELLTQLIDYMSKADIELGKISGMKLAVYDHSVKDEKCMKKIEEMEQAIREKEMYSIALANKSATKAIDIEESASISDQIAYYKDRASEWLTAQINSQQGKTAEDERNHWNEYINHGGKPIGIDVMDEYDKKHKAEYPKELTVDDETVQKVTDKWYNVQTKEGLIQEGGEYYA